MEPLKTAGDAVSVSVTIGALLQALPHIAALLTVVWCAYRVYEIRLSIREKKLRLERLEAGHVEP